ncbi:MAG: hypothetical protein ACI95C_001492 [Pseudohongiellaceae bacterium]|jgi:hypothetical protein
MKSPLLILIRAHRKTSAAVAVITVYAAIGFLLLPWVAERQITNLLQSRLGLDASIDSLYFNPFSFYLAIDGLELEDAQLGELFTLSHSHLNFQPSRLLLLKLQVAELVVDGVALDVARFSDGSTTASILAVRWQDSAQPNTDALEPPGSDDSAALPAAEVRLLNINNVEIRLADAVPATAFSTQFRLNAFQLTDFSTLENALGNYSLTAEFEDNAPLSINGELSMVPLTTNGNLSLSGFPLPMLTRYAQDSLPLTLSSGDYSLSLDYQVDLADAMPAITVSNLNTAINSLAAVENGSASAFLSLTSLSLDGGQIMLPQNTASADEVAMDGVNIAAFINQSGEINFVRMLDQITISSTDQTPSNPGEDRTDSGGNSSPWQIDLASFALRNLSLNFNDASLQTPFEMTASVSGSIDSISNQAAAAFPYDFTLSVESGGTIASSGEVIALPGLALDSSLTVAQLNLSAVQPYLNEFATVVLERGNINLETALTITTDEPFAARGGFALDSLLITDANLFEDLVTLERLNVDDFAFSLAANTIEASVVSIDELYSRVIINEDGSTNIGRSIKEAEENTQASASDTATNDTETSETLGIILGRLSINNAAANFTDRSLPIIFNANIRDLNGSAEGLASNTQEATTIDLEGQVDEFGLVQISSSLYPFNITQSSDIDGRFTNIDMPSMTPYVIKFAGREISEGSVDLNLSYEIREGQLTASNQMVLKNLKLGERVESPEAMDLPLDLALALLKDGNGIIDLEVPITGDVNDPEFDFGPAIRSTLSNVLTNIVAAPFRLLGALVGGGGDNSLESIGFLPGRVDIAPPQQQILTQLGEALIQRPQLMLEVPPVSASEDILALKTAAVNRTIESSLEALAEDTRLLTQRRRQVLETLYTATAQAQPLLAIQQLYPQPSDPAAPATQTPQLDVVAYNAELRQRLIQAQFISEQELNGLAVSRANAVLEFMTATAGINGSQIRLIDPATSALDVDGWLVMKFGLGPAN